MFRRRSTTLLASAALLFAAPTAAIAFEASVTRTAEGDLVAQWTAEGPVDVYVAGAPHAALDAATLVSDDDADGKHLIAEPAAASRTYVLLVAADGTTVQAAERLLPLEGGRNFRDLGGYRAEDGRRVKWGQVYRSGAMHQLTDADFLFLANLGVETICDFRATSERANEPTDWRAGEIEMLVEDYEIDLSDFEAAFADGMTPERATAVMIGFYRQTANRYATQYARMFDRLATTEAPLLFNCTAGKDRTGVAAALVLTALGVPRAQVLEDYALSDKVVDYSAELAGEPGEVDPNDPNAAFYALPPEILAPFMKSDPAYLEAAFAQIEADHGDVATFLRDVLAVTDEELAAIRARLLE